MTAGPKVRRPKPDRRPWEVIDTEGTEPPRPCWYEPTARELAAALNGPKGNRWKVTRRKVIHA